MTPAHRKIRLSKRRLNVVDIRGFELSLRAAGYRPDTIRRAVATATTFLNSHPESVETFLADAGERVKRITLRNYHRDLSMFFRWAVSKGLVDANPMIDIPVPRPSLHERERDTRFLPYTDADFQKLLDAVPPFWQGWLGLRDRALLWVLWETPLRASEICGLHEDDVAWGKSELVVRSGKGGVKYEALMSTICTENLHDYLMKRPDSEWLFAGRSGDKLTPHALGLLLRRIATRAKFAKPLTPHLFRHHFRARMRGLGFDDAAISALLGHSTVVVTHSYARQAAREMAKAQLRQRLA